MRYLWREWWLWRGECGEYRRFMRVLGRGFWRRTVVRYVREGVRS
jgi:hypothetical protein